MGFKALEGDFAIVSQSGGYKQCDLYEWDNKLFAKVGSVFVRLKADGSTSKENVRMEHLEYDGEMFRDRFGRLTTVGGEGYQQVMAHADGRIEVLKLEDKTEEESPDRCAE